MATFETTGFSDFTIPGAEPNYPPDLGLEPTHLDVTLELDIPARSARGSVVVTVRANRAGVRRLELDAVDFEDVAVADPAGGDLTYDYDGTKLTVLWTDPFDAGETRDVRVAYSVVEPVSGLHFSVPDEDYPDRAPWAATDHETERARYWLPCVDLPAVRTSLAFHLTAPSDLTILANGLLEGEEANGGGTKTAHWRLDWPCPSYLVCFAVGDFVRADDEPVGGREIAYFAARGRATPEDLLRSFGRTPAIMAWLQKRLGSPFPFPKYFQFALPQFGGAMENISLVSWDDSLVADGAYHRDLGDVIDIVNVHEMAHSWFGDSVVIRDFAHAWLKESWATYLQACYSEDVKGEDEFRHDLFQFARAYMTEADGSYRRPIVTRVFNSSWEMYDRHLYPGGAFRLHMLRRILGDDVFWPAVTDYLQTYSRRTVETEDFRRMLETHSGRSLVRFFDEWIYGTGYPKLKATFSFDAEKKRGSLTIEQSQVPEKPDEKKNDAPTLFHFDLVVAWPEEDGTFSRRTLTIGRRKETFLLPMAKKPEQIRIDPDGDVLHALEFNPGDDMLRHALRHAPDPIGRVLAAEELAKTGKRANLRAIAAALPEEPFWGARSAMAIAVAKSKAAAAPGILIDLLASETEPRVLRTIADQMAPYRDPRVAAALAGFLDRDDLTPVVRAAALGSLGAQRGEEHLARLLLAAEAESWRDVVRRGALVGLAATHTEIGFAELYARNGYGREPDDSAATAAATLATAAGHVEKRLRVQAIEKLRDLLREPRDRVRRAAAAALGTLGAKEAAGDIERYLPTLPAQDRPRGRRILMKLAGDPAGKPDSSALEDRIEKLEENNRKLEERIDALEREPVAES